MLFTYGVFELRCVLWYRPIGVKKNRRDPSPAVP